MGVGFSAVVAAARVEAATRTWTGLAEDGLFETASPQSNWGNIGTTLAPPGSTTQTATNTTNADLARFNVPDATQLDVEMGVYRSLGGFHFLEPLTPPEGYVPGTVRIHNFVLSSGTATSHRINAVGANNNAVVPQPGIHPNAEIFRVEVGNVIIEGTKGANPALRFGRWNNYMTVATGSMLTLDLRTGFVHTASTITKRGGGTVVFKAPVNGGQNSTDATQSKFTIEEGMFRIETGADAWRSTGSNGVRIFNGAALELVDSSYGNVSGEMGTLAQLGNSSGDANTHFEGYAYATSLVLNGSGPGGLGVLRASGTGTSIVRTGSNAASAVNPSSTILETDSSIGVAAGATLVITDDLSDPRNPVTNPTGSTSGLTKVGGGTLILEAASSYHGETVVAGGTLLINTQRNPVTKKVNLVGAPAPADPVLIPPSYNAGTGVTQFQLTQDVTTAGLSVGAKIGNSILTSMNTSQNVFLFGEDATSAINVIEPDVYGEVTFQGIDRGLYYWNDGSEANLVTVKSGATLGGTGKIIGTHVSVESGGFLAPGASIGKFDVGSATLSSGTLKIEFGNDEIDKLTVAGALDISGGVTFDFTSLGSLSNNSYEFASFGSLMGGLGNVTVMFNGQSGLPSGLALNQVGNSFVLQGSYAPGVPGDFNGDGNVDAADYVIWRKTMPDDAAKYNEWRANFGSPPGSGSSLQGAGGVPEPASLTLGAMLGAVVVFSRGQFRLARR